MNDVNEKRLTLHYTFIQISFFIHVCFVNGFVAYYLSENGYNSFQTGLVIGISNILSLFIQPYVASFADHSLKLRIKHIIAINTSVSILFALATHLISNRCGLFLVFYTCLLLSIAIQVPLLNSLSTEHITRGTKLNYSIARGFGSIAFAGTSIVFGMLAEKFGASITMPYYISSSLVYLIMVLTFKAPKKFVTMESNTSKDIINFVMRNKRFMMTTFALFLVYYSPSLISNYLFHVVVRVGGDASNLGIALGLSATLELVSMVLYPLARKRLGGNARILIITSFMFFVKIFCTYSAKTLYGLYFAQSLQLLSFGFYIPAQVYYVSNVIPAEDQVKGQMFMSMSGTLAVVVSSFFGGYLLNNFGMNVTLMSGIILNIIGFVLLLFVIEKEPSNKSNGINALQNSN